MFVRRAVNARPWSAVLDRRGYALVDGGLATALESAGEVLDTSLWSAAVLATRPDSIRAVHDAFLAAGADILIAATYQASVQGFAEAGIGEPEAALLMRRAVELAREACAARGSTALVAASIGPYGAMLGGGAEYAGDYGVPDEKLERFHRGRLDVLAAAGADLLAVETIPGDAEGRVLAALLDEKPGPPAWIAFSCRDGRRLHDGSAIERAVARFAGVQRVGAVGVNCSDPVVVESLVRRIRDAAPGKDIVVYPNLGGRWDAEHRHWGDGVPDAEFVELSTRWYDAGARLIGGCCRVAPNLVEAVGRRLDAHVRESAGYR